MVSTQFPPSFSAGRKLANAENEIPPVVVAIAASLKSLRSAVADFSTRLEGIAAGERAQRCAAGYQGETFVVDAGDGDANSILQNGARCARLALVDFAQSNFTAPGVFLKIPTNVRDAGRSVEDADNFDPLKFWRFLEKQYGNGRGEMLAYADSARELSSAFNLDPGTEIKTVSGRVLLVCKTSRSAMGNSDLESNSEERLNRAIKGLAAVGVWSGVWSSTHEADRNSVETAIRAAGRYGGAKPDRMAIGDLALIVPFLSKWEFRLAPDFAEKVQLFLAEFKEA